MNIDLLKKEHDELMEKITELRARWAVDDREPTAEEMSETETMVERVNVIRSILEAEEKASLAVSDGEKRNQRKTVQGEGQNAGMAGVNKPDPKKAFESGAEFLRAVREAESGNIDPRLLRAATGLQESVGSDGGFLVPMQYANELLKNMWDNSEVPKRIRRIPITSNALTIPGVDETSRVAGSRSGGIRSYWAAEADEKTASKPKFRRIEMKLKKLIGLCYATDELLEDAVALDAAIRQGFQEEFNFAITDAIINGNGAGQPLGIMNAGSLVTASKVAAQAATTFVGENVLAMWARLKASSTGNVVWLINQDVTPQLYAIDLGGGNQLVFVNPDQGGLRVSPSGGLMGRPIIPCEQCQTLGTAGDVILADLSQYVAIERGSMAADVSIHVRFQYDESVYRFVYRFDGQPVLASAITPYLGSNTVSHNVVMETRS